MINFPYISTKTENIEYLGVTSWLGSFEAPFIPEEVARKVSKNPNSEYFDIPISDIIKMWNDTATRGNRKHKEIEDWLKGVGEKNEHCSIIENSLGISPDNSFAEIKLYCDEFRLTGKPDIIQEIKEKDYTIYNIHDIKTFKKNNKDKLIQASKQILIYCKMLRELIRNDDIIIRPGKIIVISPKNNISENVWFEFSEPEIFDIEKGIMEDLIKMFNDRLQQF